MAAPIDPTKWCPRVFAYFRMFREHPSTLQHMLLYGPPGSGKTSSAEWLIRSLWGDHAQLMAMNLNAADERSLEAIRQKIFPFLRTDWRRGDQCAIPRFLVLDECETLTDAAQLSLQTVLSYSPQDLCVIMISNSHSRIHIKLRQRVLKIRFDIPRATGGQSEAFSFITRNDMRQHRQTAQIERRLWTLLNGLPEDIRASERHSLLTDVFLLACELDLLTPRLLGLINQCVVFLSDCTPFSESFALQGVEAAIAEFRSLLGGGSPAPDHHPPPHPPTSEKMTTDPDIATL